MKKLKNFAAKLQTKAMMAVAGATQKEKGDHLLEVLGTIIIAVVVLILFKGAIVNIFTSALNETTTSVNNLFSNAYSGGGVAGIHTIG